MRCERSLSGLVAALSLSCRRSAPAFLPPIHQSLTSTTVRSFSSISPITTISASRSALHPLQSSSFQYPCAVPALRNAPSSVDSTFLLGNQVRTKYHKARVVLKRHCPHCVVTTRKQYALVVCRAHPEHNQRATLQPMRARRWPAQSWTDRHAKSPADDYAKDFEALAKRKLEVLEWQNRVETERRTAAAAVRQGGDVDVHQREDSVVQGETEGTWISDTIADIPLAPSADEVSTESRRLLAGRVPAALVRYKSTKWKVEPPWKAGVRRVQIAKYERRVKKMEESAVESKGGSFVIQGGF
ncbi:hypothetical protein M427DRAFT_135287 [Gonapodya prolifera JEL478]|uniref:Ribosomal protein n=1 Tax=Gonapodya prolifera (strain JEL478) TaxID=1344416 RepID=A0A139AE06_GONPJ|nr:hypothetical protein M427DRAFT_135287 [Gonapodya prolifera JEL478]|eukprot:KXS15052.1 hypothetical protein M427DRAFT_135287 [Gonapodya prolifera JEL478]